MFTEVTSMDRTSRDFAIEKVKWTTANEYAQRFGMNLVEAFVATVASFTPSDTIISYDLNTFNEERAKQPEEDRWMFDWETILALDSIFKEKMFMEYPDAVLTHMFPDTSSCEMILKRAMSNVSRSN